MVQLALKSRCLGELTCIASKPISGHRNQPWRHHQAPAPCSSFPCRESKHLALHAIAAALPGASRPGNQPTTSPWPAWAGPRPCTRCSPAAGAGEASPCVWQKGILMGGKCQLPDFSGAINYDPAGNLVAPARPGRAVPAAIGLGWWRLRRIWSRGGDQKKKKKNVCRFLSGVRISLVQMFFLRQLKLPPETCSRVWHIWCAHATCTYCTVP